MPMLIITRYLIPYFMGALGHASWAVLLATISVLARRGVLVGRRVVLCCAGITEFPVCHVLPWPIIHILVFPFIFFPCLSFPCCEFPLAVIPFHWLDTARYS